MRTIGVKRVIQFNWPKVLGGFGTAIGGLMTWRRLPIGARVVVAGAAIWTPLSLAASWWVYDRSPLAAWRFFAGSVASPKSILVVTAGFDEVSQPLRTVFPEAKFTIVDVVADPEPSVRRARALYPSEAPIVDPARLDQQGAVELIVFAQSAHEVRDVAQSNAMFAAARAALTANGRVVVVEHLRDLANAIAFGPGVLHFQSRRHWLAGFEAGGLEVVDHQTITPLVHCWVLKAS